MNQESGIKKTIKFRFRISTLLVALIFCYVIVVPVGFNVVGDGFVGIENVYAVVGDDGVVYEVDTDPTNPEGARILPQCGGEDTIGSERYDLNSFLWLLILILRWIFSITGSLAVLMFVYGGYMWLLSVGEEQRVKEGRTTMINAVIGVGIILGSWLGVNVIIATLTGAPQGVNSVTWNSVGAHCKGITEPIKFVKKPPPVAPPAAPSGGTPPPGTTPSPSPSPAPTPPVPKKCYESGAPPCPTDKICDTVSTSTTYGQCIDIPTVQVDCDPPCTGGKICNKRTKKCETTPTGECCYTILVEDDCVDFNRPPDMTAAYLRSSTKNLCIDQNLTNFTTRPDIFGKENDECPGMSWIKGIKRKIINRNFCEHKSCNAMNTFNGTWTCK